ncbi:MAG: EAL domain-containing protein, partial [Mycobacterium sp.]|nr:EAL domain-containing protein [Mycobacterium sp.]
ALLRWSHPEHGLLLPGQFLPLVRSDTLMAEITRLVLELALDDAQRWRQAGLDIPVAVNVFTPTMADLSLPDRVFAALEQRDLRPGSLTMEMTEDLPLGRVGPTKSVLGELRDRGVRISIDDFGAGYPALSYLCHLPIDEIKLDRSFIGPNSSSPRVESVVRAAVDLGRELGLTTVAEGVRDADTAARLLRWGFDVAQGDFFGEPMPAAKVPGLTVAR